MLAVCHLPRCAWQAAWSILECPPPAGYYGAPGPVFGVDGAYYDDPYWDAWVGGYYGGFYGRGFGGYLPPQV